MPRCNCVSELPRGVEAVPTHPRYNDRLKRIEQVFKVEGHYWQDSWDPLTARRMILAMHGPDSQIYKTSELSPEKKAFHCPYCKEVG